MWCEHDQQLDRRGTEKMGAGLQGEKHNFRARLAGRISAKMRGGQGTEAGNAVKKKRTTEKIFFATLYLVRNNREVAPNES